MGKGDSVVIPAVAIVRSATSPNNQNVIWWDTSAEGSALNNKLKVFNTSTGKWSIIDGTSKTGQELLNELKKVDGPGSGLDADTLDGFHASAFVKSDGSYVKQDGAAIYGLAQGTDTYTTTLSPTPAQLQLGNSFNIKFDNANTGASTLNVNGLGAISIVKKDGTALSAGDIPAGSINNIIYDGTNFQLGAAVAVGANDLQSVITAGGTYTGSDSIDIDTTGSIVTEADSSNSMYGGFSDAVGRGLVTLDPVKSVFRYTYLSQIQQIQFSSSSGMVVTDDRTSQGLIYAADYSGAFVARSLVDKAYVDAQIAAHDLQGVLDSGSTASLTSTEVKATVVDGINSGFVQVTSGGEPTLSATNGTNTTLVQLEGNGGITIESSNGVNESGISIGISSLLVKDLINSKGFVYQGDYSANYTARSLVDKGYVDGQISAIPSLTVGSNDQIPYSNSGGTDFDYIDNFKYNGNELLIGNSSFYTDSTLTVWGISGRSKASVFFDTQSASSSLSYMSNSGAANSGIKGGIQLDVRNTGTTPTGSYGILATVRDSNTAIAKGSPAFYGGHFAASFENNTGYAMYLDARQVNSGDNYGLYVHADNTGSGNAYGVYQVGANASNYFAGNIGIGISPSNGWGISLIRNNTNSAGGGLEASGRNTGATNLGNMVGVQGDVQATSSGNITTAKSISSNSVIAAGTSTITNAYNFYGQAHNESGGTITNAYGLYLEAQTVGATNWSIYSAGGQNYFAGNTGIGIAPDSAIELNIASTLGTTIYSNSTANNSTNTGIRSEMTTGASNANAYGVYTDVDTTAGGNAYGGFFSTKGSASAAIGSYSKVGGGNVTGLSYGAYNLVQIDGALTTGSTMYGSLNVVTVSTTGTHGSTIIGSGVDLNYNKVGGSLTSAFGFYSTGIVANDAGATINTAYGLYLGDNTGAGTITNSYGIYQVGSDDQNYFAGNVGIGTTPVTGSVLTLATATNNLEFIESVHNTGLTTAASTLDGYIKVEIGGNVMYLNAYSDIPT